MGLCLNYTVHKSECTKLLSIGRVRIYTSSIDGESIASRRAPNCTPGSPKGPQGWQSGGDRETTRYLPGEQKYPQVQSSIQLSRDIPWISLIFVDRNPRLAAARRAETRRNVTAASRPKKVWSPRQ